MIWETDKKIKKTNGSGKDMPKPFKIEDESYIDFICERPF